MVHQRIFQTVKRLVTPHSSLGIVPRVEKWDFGIVVLLCFLGITSNSQADTVLKLRVADAFSTHSALLLDLRDQDFTTRSSSQKRYEDALGEHGEIKLLSNTEAIHLLARIPYSPIKQKALQTLEQTATAFAQLDCDKTQNLANAAVLQLAEAQASQAIVSQQLHQTYLYRLLCADRRGQTDLAMAAARHLRSLEGDKRPSEISEKTWQKYPHLDAQSNLQRVSVKLISTPPGATVWMDHRALGVTPISVLIPEGEHIFAVASSEGSTSQRVTVIENQELLFPLKTRESQWGGLPDLIEKLYQSQPLIRNSSMRSLMVAVDVEIALVLTKTEKVQVWILPPNHRNALLAGVVNHESEVGTMALEALRASKRRPGLDPTMPLLRENDVPEESQANSTRWWIYGVVLGAAAAGAGIILLQDLQEDRQRIEVTFP